MYKSPAELANMQFANDITIAGFKAGFATLREGMTQGELSGNVAAAFRQLGATGGVSVSFGAGFGICAIVSAPVSCFSVPTRFREGCVI